MLSGEEVQQYTTVYCPPFDEFEVYRVALPSTRSTIVPANQVSQAFGKITGRLYCLQTGDLGYVKAPKLEKPPFQHRPPFFEKC